MFSIQEGEGQSLVLGSRILIQRYDHDSDKNTGMLKALVRANPSYSVSALTSLLGFKDKDDNCELKMVDLSRKLAGLDYIFCSFLCSPAGSTSTGLSVQMLQKSVGYTTGSSLILLTPPPAAGGGRGNMFGMQASHPPKSLCLNFCYNALTGKSVPQVDLQPSGQLRCALTSKGASITTMGKEDCGRSMGFPFQN